MKRKSDPIKDLHRLLDAQKFESLEELQKFMEEISKNPIPEIPEEDLTPGATGGGYGSGSLLSARKGSEGTGPGRFEVGS